jgi:N-acyl-L-homoserine lactone synthetase
MTHRIRLAETAADLDALFRLRHRVYAEEKGWLPGQADGRIADRFDALPHTANIVAVIEGRVVGGVRFVEAGPLGTPADHYFDFSPFLPPGARVGSGGMLCLEPDLRQTPRLLSAMVGMGYHWALARGITHLVAPITPEVAPIFLATGAQAVAPEFFHAESGLPVVPVMLDLADLGEHFLTFARRQGLAHFLRSFERQFHAAGETIIRQGDEGTALFVVVEGEVAVTLGEQRVELARLSRGETFGELAALTSRPRSADVVALTDVDLMVLDRPAFQAQLQSDPEVALRLLEILGTRLAELDERLVAVA